MVTSALGNPSAGPSPSARPKPIFGCRCEFITYIQPEGYDMTETFDTPAPATPGIIVTYPPCTAKNKTKLRHIWGMSRDYVAVWSTVVLFPVFKSGYPRLTVLGNLPCQELNIRRQVPWPRHNITGSGLLHCQNRKVFPVRFIRLPQNTAKSLRPPNREP